MDSQKDSDEEKNAKIIKQTEELLVETSEYAMKITEREQLILESILGQYLHNMGYISKQQRAYARGIIKNIKERKNNALSLRELIQKIEKIDVFDEKTKEIIERYYKGSLSKNNVNYLEEVLRGSSPLSSINRGGIYFSRNSSPLRTGVYSHLSLNPENTPSSPLKGLFAALLVSIPQGKTLSSSPLANQGSQKKSHKEYKPLKPSFWRVVIVGAFKTTLKNSEKFRDEVLFNRDEVSGSQFVIDIFLKSSLFVTSKLYHLYFDISITSPS